MWYSKVKGKNDEVKKSLDKIKSLLVESHNKIIKRIIKSEKKMEEILAAVAVQNEVVLSVVTLLNGLHAKLDEAIAANDPVKMKEVSDAIAANTQKLAEAVAANTVHSH